ncbi:hypothetical protein Bca52824_011217 [Brassica carinata]|uniref:Uncharacterized protein n=1 Tax=Brassica carinata TaxID=52824 RepID=A0A8X7WEX2_BRACI|nr:hypothetical protein Bca52824_011217 [Brassica carinata]
MVAQSKRKETTSVVGRGRRPGNRNRPSVRNSNSTKSYRSTNSVFVVSESNAGGSGSERDFSAQASSADEVRDPDASRTATFLDDPTACANTVTILTVQDIVFVETDPAFLPLFFVSIVNRQFHPNSGRRTTPVVEEVQDSQVTSLVEIMHNGETFKLEDIPGGDTSFRRDLEKKNTGRLQKDEKWDPVTVHQQNLRPRKHVVVNIEVSSSSGDSEPPGPPQSGRCTHKELKPLMLVHFEKLSNQIYEMGRNIYRGLGLPEETIHSSRKRKASDGHHRKSASPTSIGLQTQRPARKVKKMRKTVVSSLVEKRHSYALRCGDGNDVTVVVQPKLFCLEFYIFGYGVVLTRLPFIREPKETMQHQNRERRARKRRVTMLETRTPNAAENAQQQETPSTAVVLYEDVLCAQPQSYVSPPKAFCRSSRLPSQVGESKPHLYRSVGTVRSIHTSWKAKPSSKGTVASIGSEDGGVTLSQQLSTEKNQTPSVSHASGETSNLEVPNTGEKLAKVPSLTVEDGRQDPLIVEETNPEFPTMEEEERYDSYREDMSTDTQMQEKLGNPVSETEEDSSFVPSCGKQQRKRSNKIGGVYTLEGRAKTLFEREKKVEYRPIAKMNRAVYKKFSEILRGNPSQVFRINTGHDVTNCFFFDIGEPEKWLSDEIKQGSMSVSDYAEFFLCHQIMKTKNEQDMIQIALDGLKEEICDGLESTELATLGSLFGEAAEVEDILEKEKSPQKSPRIWKSKTRPNSCMDPEDEDPWDEPGDDDGEESGDAKSDDEDNDEEWAYEGETQVKVDEDDEETDHIRDENTDDASGVGEPGSQPDASGSVADPSPSVAASVADPSPSGHGTVADSSASVSATVDDSSASVVVK